MSSEASALYLASKSNYQHIMEGTKLPGLSYPNALAENLSSKRTSHKVAEQGRRNRINVALKEIETLLPAALLGGSPTKGGKSKKEDKDGKEDGDDEGANGKSAAQSASKAHTVEMAIIYIKSLQEELAKTQARLAQAEGKVGQGSSTTDHEKPATSNTEDSHDAMDVEKVNGDDVAVKTSTAEDSSNSKRSAEAANTTSPDSSFTLSSAASSVSPAAGVKP